MDLAYINYLDNPAHKRALANLTRHLQNEDIEIIASNKPYQHFANLLKEPFLYFRNPFVRLIPSWPVCTERKILNLHRENSFAYIETLEGEVVSINPANINNYFFKINEHSHILSEQAFITELAIPKKKRAIMAMVQDGTPYLDIWLNYYKKYFEDKDIYFICCNSPQETQIKLSPYSIIETEVSVYNMVDKLALLNRLQKEFLNYYEVVMYADIDEIIFHPTGLGNVLNSLRANITRSEGYDIVHYRSKESNDLDLSKPIAGQRLYWARADNYDKPTILKEPYPWTLGLHALDTPNNIHWRHITDHYPGLLLLHLRNADFKIASTLTTKNNKNGEKLIGGGQECLYVDEKLNQWWSTYENAASQIPLNIINSLNF